MPYDVPLDDAKKNYPEYEFVAKLTPSEQKAAFHVRKGGEDLCLKIINPTYELDRLNREVAALQVLRASKTTRSNYEAAASRSSTCRGS